MRTSGPGTSAPHRITAAIVGAILAATAVGALGGEQATSAPDAADRAKRLAAEGKADEAIGLLRKAVAAEPDERAWGTLIDLTIRQGRFASALEEVRDAERTVGPRAAFCFGAARAYFELGELIGEARERRVHGGRTGQFRGDWLLIEPREGRDTFLCCPPASALYQVRRALDGGVDEPAAHLLHARIWQRLSKPEMALAVLNCRRATLLEHPDGPTLETFAELSLATDRLEDYLRYEQMRAELGPDEREAILQAAFLRVAERYNQKGEPALHRALLRRALAQDPSDPKVLLQLADALWEANAREEATRAYRRVLERDPRNPERERLLSRVAEVASEEINESK